MRRNGAHSRILQTLGGLPPRAVSRRLPNKPSRHTTGLASFFQGWPAWQVERAKLLHRACLSIERRAAKGQPVVKAARIVSWWKRRRGLKSAKYTLRLSRTTLRRWFYIWRKQRSPEVFRLNYKPGGKNAGTVRNMKLLALRIALNPAILTAQAAHRQMTHAVGKQRRKTARVVPCPKSVSRYLTGVPLANRRKLAAQQHRINTELAKIDAAITAKIAKLQNRIAE